jgi:hypothetical protein
VPDQGAAYGRPLLFGVPRRRLLLTGFTRAREYQRPLNGERLGSLPEAVSHVAFRLKCDKETRRPGA